MIFCAVLPHFRHGGCPRAARFYDGADEVHIENVGRTLQRVYAAGSSWDFSESAARPGGVTALRDDDAENHTSTGAAPSSSSKL